MKVLNIDELKAQLRPFLENYLKEHGIEEKNRKLKCPNFKVHRNKDEIPAASFFPGDKEHFNCFVCEAAGDIFNAAFYIENRPLRGQEFITENVLYLAKKYKIPYEIAAESQDERDKKQIYQVVDSIVKYANKCLVEKPNERAKEYIESRGWGEAIESFHLGHCKSNDLYKWLTKRGITDELIESAGIKVMKNADGTVYIPVIEDRIIIPFRNYFGKISSVVSRAILPTGKPKYLFTHNSLIHEKSKELFNLNEAKKYSKDVYIVESNASVLTMFVNDVKNVVAISGKDMTIEQYNLLVRMNIEKIFLCLDNDDAGKDAVEKFIYTYKEKTDFQVYVKELPRLDDKEDKNLKDPDDFIKKYGIDKFLNLPIINSFEWILNKYSIDLENEYYKEMLISLVLSEKNFLKRERMVKKFASKTGFTQKVLLQEIERFSTSVELITSVREIIDAKESLINDINSFEEKVWSRKEGLLGFDVDWPIFNKIFDGLQGGFCAVAGRTNIGKSAFMLSLALQVLKKNAKSAYVLYFSIDDSIGKCIGRIISIKSQIPINWVKNPKFKIRDNVNFTEAGREEMLDRRSKSVESFKALSQSFAFKSQSNIEAMEKTIRLYQSIAQNESKKLIVFVDKIHNCSSNRNYAKRELTDYVSMTLKKITNDYDIPLIGSLEVIKSSIMERPNESHIKETQKLEDDSDATILLYNDLKINPDSLYIFEHEGLTCPIVEASVPKNKLSDLSGYDVKIFYKFYTSLSYMEECSDEEQQYFRSL